MAQIPYGLCVGYGTLGQALSHPVSGLIVGRWMRHCPADLPWWRVVGGDGRLPIAQRDPGLAHEQRARLISEGVRFDGDVIDMREFGWTPESDDRSIE